MSKNTLLSELINYISANASGNVVIATPTSGLALDVNGTGRFTGQLTLGSTITNGTYTYTLPSATGTLALTSQIPSVTGFVPYSGATSAVNLGIYALFTSGTYITKVGTSSGAIFFEHGSSGTLAPSGYSAIGITGTDGIVMAFNGSSNTITFKNNLLSAAQIYSLPNASGTIALTSNLSSYLPLSGGTLTGALGGTSATFSSSVTANGGINQTTAIITLAGNENSAAAYPSLLGFSSYNSNYGITSVGYIGYSMFGAGFTFDAIGRDGVDGFNFRTKTSGTTYSRMFITNTGNVGIGTTSPGFPLQVTKTGTDSGIYGYNVAQFGDATTNAQGLRIATSTATSGLTNLIAATNNDASQFAFWTWTGSAWGERMRITSGGNVGIGTTSPNQKLHVTGSGDVVSLVETAAGSFAQYRLLSGSGGTPWVFGTQSDYLSGSLVFRSSTNKMVLTTGGNLGIGTDSPQAALDVINSGTYQLRVASGTGSYSNGKIYFGGLNTGDPFYYGTIGWDQSDVTMRIGAQCGNATGGIAFYTSANSSAQTEKMRITSGGNLLVGTTTATAKITIGDGVKASNSTPFAIQTSDTNNMMLVVSRNINLYYNIEAIEQGVSYRSIYFNLGGGGVYAGTQRLDNNSDIRVKHNIKPITNALNTIMSLSGKMFNMRDENNINRYGFIAQEVQPILNDFVTRSNRTYRDGDYVAENILTLESSGSAWGALLVEAIKEQQVQIQDLKQQLANK